MVEGATGATPEHAPLDPHGMVEHGSTHTDEHFALTFLRERNVKNYNLVFYLDRKVCRRHRWGSRSGTARLQVRRRSRPHCRETANRALWKEQVILASCLEVEV